jgi:hypothetical protein
MKPFNRARVPRSEIDQLVRALSKQPAEYFVQYLGENPEPGRIQDFIAQSVDHAMRAEFWRNDRYQVAIYRDDEPAADFPKLLHLSIKRIDRRPIHDWRELQAIKNLLVSPEAEGIELYPAESRRVDMANQYHLFVLADPGLRFPFGFKERVVSDEPIGKSLNRPLDP